MICVAQGSGAVPALQRQLTCLATITMSGCSCSSTLNTLAIAPRHPNLCMPSPPPAATYPTCSIPTSQLADPAHADVQLVFKGVQGGTEQWDNNAGRNWQVGGCTV